MYLLLIILLRVYFGQPINYLQDSFLRCFMSLTWLGLKITKLPILQAVGMGLVWFEKNMSYCLRYQIPTQEQQRKFLFLLSSLRKQKTCFVQL